MASLLCQHVVRHSKISMVIPSSRGHHKPQVRIFFNNTKTAMIETCPALHSAIIALIGLSSITMFFSNTKEFSAGEVQE